MVQQMSHLPFKALLQHPAAILERAWHRELHDDEQRALAFEEWQKMGKLLGVADKYIFKTEEEYWNHFNYIIEEKLVTIQVFC